MPIYEYECERCKFTCEALRSIDHRDEKLVCPKCVINIHDSQLMTRCMGNFKSIIFNKPYC